MKYHIALCKHCGEVFTRHHSQQVYCSTGCRVGGERECLSCGKLFVPKLGTSKFSKYCSRACSFSRTAYQRQELCKHCGKEFIKHQPSQKYCSSSCRCRGRRCKNCGEPSFQVYCSRTCFLHKKYEIRLCERCGKAFERTTASRIYCSRTCRVGGERQCKVCGSDFIPKSESLRAEYCSNKCIGKEVSRRAKNKATHYLEKRICKTCDIVFIYDTRSAQRNMTSKGLYCSPDCMRRRSRIGPQMGEERAFRLIGHHKEWYVYDGEWQRKARLVVEEMIGRSIRQYERIIFKDGNRLNCEPGNLLVSDIQSHRIHVCQSCGKSRACRRHERIRHDNYYCQKCANTTLTERKVSCIRTLSCDIPQVMLARWFLVGRTGIFYIKRGRTRKGVQAMAKSKTWEVLLEQHDELVRDSNATLYDRVTLLVEVYQNRGFKSAMKKEDKNPVDFLNKKLSDTAVNFTELWEILKEFPRRKQWEEGDLSDMRIHVINKIRQAQQSRKEGEAGKENGGKGKPNGKGKGHSSRKSATLAKLREMEESIKDRDSQLEHLQSENVHLRNQLQQANQMIKILENRLEQDRETIGGLNETISLLRMESTKAKGRKTRERSTS